jgi:hypothetical protein
MVELQGVIGGARRRVFLGLGASGPCWTGRVHRFSAISRVSPALAQTIKAMDFDDIEACAYGVGTGGGGSEAGQIDLGASRDRNNGEEGRACRFSCVGTSRTAPKETGSRDDGRAWPRTPLCRVAILLAGLVTSERCER